MDNKGSEWKKWNLHVHTKGTNKNDQFTSPTLDTFFYTFFKYAYSNQIEAIGITDYFSIERYKDALKYVSEIENKIDVNSGEKLFTEPEIAFIKNIFLFPNVELRMLPATDRGRLINIHCLFNPEYVEHLENDFFGHIENQDGKKMNRHGLINYGQSLNSTLSTDELKYKKGVDNFVIDLKTLKNLLANNKDFQNNCILVVSNSNNDGASAVQKHYDLFENEEGSLDGLRSSIYKISHSIFSTNPKDIKYFLGKRLESTEGYNIKIFKKEVEEVIEKRGSLKSCLVGCDSHIESTLFERFTWIKGKLNFEGLRQICFEPEQRVKIQNSKPDFKEDKVIIDKVKFVSTSKAFNNKEIHLNQNLNVIIGGKSSGKSILLYSIAKTLLPDQSVLLNDNDEEKYSLKSIDSDFNFEITSRAGISQKMFRDTNENSIIPDIKYIPQNYLVKLAEPELNKKGKPLNKLVRDLINEDIDSKTKYDSFIKNVKQIDKDREILIEKYFELIDDTKTLEINLKTKSNKEVLETNISTNTKKVEELNKEAGLTPEELEKYKAVQEKQLLNQQKTSDYKSDLSLAKSTINDIKQVVGNLYDSKETFLNSIKLESIKQNYIEKLIPINSLKDAIDKLIEEMKIESGENETKYFVHENIFKSEMETIQYETNAINSELKPFQNNDEIQKQIGVLNESISNDKKFLLEIETLNKQITDKKVSIQKCHQDLFQIYDKCYLEYTQVINELKERTIELEKDGLKIEGIAQFNFSKLYKNIYDISDGRKASYNSYPEILNQKKKATASFQYEIIKKEIEKIFDDIMSENYAILPRIDKKNSIKILLEDYFFDYWKITYKNDKLGEMSTGKASFVILMLIIGLSKSKSPILIDQPEDNLDNRSITRDLVNYLKNKKLERQIIVVTHNANIVVNSDAENVIVANQKGQNDSESTSEFLFDYINGAIEDTFLINETEKDLLISMGIREHIAEIVEGGKDAFMLREKKYRFEKNIA
jgi:energy-coupling factor transporter ATP-binding protein EcfA2